jgi:hypothetical protein
LVWGFHAIASAFLSSLSVSLCSAARTGAPETCLKELEGSLVVAGSEEEEEEEEGHGGGTRGRDTETSRRTTAPECIASGKEAGSALEKGADEELVAALATIVVPGDGAAAVLDGEEASPAMTTTTTTTAPRLPRKRQTRN